MSPARLCIDEPCATLAISNATTIVRFARSFRAPRMLPFGSIRHTAFGSKGFASSGCPTAGKWSGAAARGMSRSDCGGSSSCRDSRRVGWGLTHIHIVLPLHWEIRTFEERDKNSSGDQVRFSSDRTRSTMLHVKTRKRCTRQQLHFGIVSCVWQYHWWPISSLSCQSAKLTRTLSGCERDPNALCGFWMDSLGWRQILHHAARNETERFRVFLELIGRFEFESSRRGKFFWRIRIFGLFKVQLHTPCGCKCACAVACLCPHNSISNIVVSLTIHDDMYMFMYLSLRDVAKTWNHCGRSKTSSCAHTRTLSYTDTYKYTYTYIYMYMYMCVCVSVCVCVCQGMIGGIGNELLSTYSQNWKWVRSVGFFGGPLGPSDDPTWANFGKQNWRWHRPAFRVSLQNVPVYVGTTRTCWKACARVAGIHGDVLNVYTEVFSVPHHTAHTQHNTHRHNTTQHHTQHHTEKRERERDRERRQEKMKETRQDKRR